MKQPTALLLRLATGITCLTRMCSLGSAANLQNLETTKIQATTCSTPTATSSFSTTDSSIWEYFLITGLNRGDLVVLTWNRPVSGSYQSNWQIQSAGSYCFVTSLSNSQFATYPGGWFLAVSINGVFQSQRAYFTLAKPTSPSPQITSPSASQLFHLTSADPPSVTVPLSTAVNTSDVRWGIWPQFYRAWSTTASDFNPVAGATPFIVSPASHPSAVITSQGGQVNITATYSTNIGAGPNLNVYVDGTNPASDVLSNRLVSAYSGVLPSGGTPKLFIGVAFVESTSHQFGSFASGQPFKHPAYNVTAMWPVDNSAGYGGLLGVPTTGPNAMQNLFNWTASISSGMAIFQQKISTVQASYQNLRPKFPRLPPLTGIQIEDNALVLYSGNFPYGGYYWIPNSAGTGWLKNVSATGASYVDKVRNYAK